MAKAADFDGKANETEVVTSESVKGKRKTSILGTKARLWLITINNPQNHGISLEQSGILERFKEDIKTGRVTYVASVIRRLLSGNYCTLPARFSDAVACYTNIIIISPLRFAEMCKCGKGYNPNILISYFTHSRRYLDLADFGTDYVLNPTSGDWEQRYLLPPHVEPKKENDHDESEQQ